MPEIKSPDIHKIIQEQVDIWHQDIVIEEDNYFEDLVEFGTDEVFALLAAAPSTMWLSTVTSNPAIIAGMSVVFEKVWLFTRSTSMALRDRWKNPWPRELWFRKEIREWWQESFYKDVFVHDPLYTVFLGAAMTAPTLRQDLPALLSSIACFFVALVLVSPWDKLRQEILHKRQKRQVTKSWAISKKYHEAKLFVYAPWKEDQIQESLRTEFKLWEREKWKYIDRYYELNGKLKSYNKRYAKIRERKRINQYNETIEDSLQIVRAKAKKVYREENWKEIKHEQTNFYPSTKEKITLPIELWYNQKIIETFTTWRSYELSFLRDFAYNSDGLYSWVDICPWVKNWFFLEWKAFEDKQLLVQFLNFVRKDNPSTHFTVWKEKVVFK